MSNILCHSENQENYQLCMLYWVRLRRIPFRAVLSSFSVNLVRWFFHCLLIRFIHINHAAEGGWRSDASDIVPIKFTLQLFKGIKQFSQVESVLGLWNWNCFKIHIAWGRIFLDIFKNNSLYVWKNFSFCHGWKNWSWVWYACSGQQ